jgi:endonuclease-3 related protein
VSHPEAAAAPRDITAHLLDAYRSLHARYRGETWHWLADAVHGPMDIVAGAVLVQHTTWTNAERALESMRVAGALDPRVLATMPPADLAALVRVSGTPTIKARRLRAVAETIVRAGGIDALLALPPDDLRARLLETHGIGPETADAIALYAAGKPAFVIDAYTRRLFGRLGLGPAHGGYAAWQRYFEDALAGEASVDLFQRYHGYIVLHAKALCRTVPRCAPCPLLPRCPEGQSQAGDAAHEAAAVPA